MSLIRLLVLAGIIWLLYRVIKKLLVKKDAGGSSTAPTPMVRCAWCNVYIVRQDACLKDQHYYCSLEHYRKRMEETRDDEGRD